MAYLGDLVRRMSAGLRRRFGDDPLRRPLGRAPDGAIDEALAARGMARADLFVPGQTVAPHRQRIAAMLAAQGLSPEQVTARHWSELKYADHACAYCIDKRRCDRWLGSRRHDRPKMFCSNAMTFERWQREDRQRDAGGLPDGDTILEAGLARTRDILKRMGLAGPSALRRR